METETITGQGVIDAAAILFSGIEHPDMRAGIVRLAAAILLPDLVDADDATDSIVESLVTAAIQQTLDSVSG